MQFVEKLNKSFSPIAFGGAAISGEGAGYGFGSISESNSLELLEYALEKEINLFDFAPIYGFDLAEKRAGIAFKNNREKVHLVSKSGVDWHDNKRVNMSNDPKVAIKMLDKTLKNINSDYIDIYLIHWPDKNVDIRLPLEVLYNAKEKGKIKHLGLCNTNKEDLELAKQVAPIEVIQMENNLFNQTSFSDLKPAISEEVLTMGWGSFDKGILTGSVKEDSVFDKSDCRSWAPWWKKGNWKEKVNFVSKTKERLGLSDEELSIAALGFSKNNVNCSICGMKSVSHIDSTIDWLSKLNPQIIEKVSSEFSSF